jgi:hypothetical protein
MHFPVIIFIKTYDFVTEDKSDFELQILKSREPFEVNDNKDDNNKTSDKAPL